MSGIWDLIITVAISATAAASFGGELEALSEVTPTVTSQISLGRVVML